MNKCVDYMEMLSAYIDGELTLSDIEKTEEHLRTCVSCSAILDLMREMSTAAKEEAAHVPEALCAGVMEKIRSGEIDAAAAKEKRQKIVRLAISRYLPMAACLALVLAALPWIIDIYGNRDQADRLYGAPGAGRSTNTMISAPAAPAPAMQDSMARTESEMAMPSGIMPGGGAMAGGGATMPGAPMPGAPGISRQDNGAGDARDVDSDRWPVADTTPVPEEAEPEPAPPAFNDTSGAPSAEQALDEVFESFEDDNAPTQASGESQDYYNRIYEDFGTPLAMISITGELPEVLSQYEPFQQEGWGQVVFYRVPRDVALEIVQEIGQRDNVRFPILNIDSDYAIVAHERASIP